VNDKNVGISFKNIMNEEEFRRFIEYFSSYVFIAAYETEVKPPSYNSIKSHLENKIILFLNEIENDLVSFKDNRLKLKHSVNDETLVKLKDKIDIFFLINNL
jgi:hypothetical protein